MELNLFTFGILFCCIFGGWCIGYGTCFAMSRGKACDENMELIGELMRLQTVVETKNIVIEDLQKINKTAAQYKEQYQKDWIAERDRADNLDIRNRELTQKNVKLHVELDALKAHNFQNVQTKTSEEVA